MGIALVLTVLLRYLGFGFGLAAAFSLGSLVMEAIVCLRLL